MKGKIWSIGILALALLWLWVVGSANAQGFAEHSPLSGITYFQEDHAQYAPDDATVLRVAPGGVSSSPCGDDWSDPCSLQYALNTAVTGTEIWVNEGLYKPGPSYTYTFQLKSGVVLYGGFAGGETERDQRDWQANLTVLSGDFENNDITDPAGIVTDTNKIVGTNSCHVVNGSGTDATARLDGFIVTAGNPWSHGTCNALGAGMYIPSESKPSIQNISFIGNRAFGNGGGIYNQGNPAITNVVFKNNVSTSGVGGGLYTTENVLLTRVTFDGNQAGEGGGVSVWGKSGNVTIREAVFINNRAYHPVYSTLGGGLQAGLNSGENLTLVNTVFRGNQTTGDGGGLNVQGGKLTLANVLISGNYAGSSGSRGGAMYIASCDPTFTNVTLSNNWSTKAGGIYISINPNLWTLTLVNSILWGNEGASGSVSQNQIWWEAGKVAMSYTDIQGGYSGDGAGPGIIDIDPRFAAPVAAAAAPTTQGDYRLLADSPAINVGNNAVVSETTDLDGNRRIVGPAVDLGAYEHPGGMQVSKKASADPVIPGSQLIYTLTITNTTSIDLHASITDTLPANVLPSGILTWTAVIPSSGGTWIQPVIVGVTDGYSGTLTNHLAVVSSEGISSTFSLTTSSRIGEQTITFDPLPNRYIDESPFLLYATASSNLPVSFTTSSAACIVDGNLVTLLYPGRCTIFATQPGNANYHAAPDVSQSFAVSKHDQFITFDPLPDKTYGDDTIPLAATSSSGLPVSFRTESTACSVIFLPLFAVRINSTGTCTVTAFQNGDDIYNPAPDVTRSFTIGKASQTITFDPLPDKTYGDSPFMLAATATSGLGVSFETHSTACSVALVPWEGFMVSILSTGTCAITAYQNGDDLYNPAPVVTQSFHIGKASQTITFAPIAHKDPDISSFPVQASASSGLPVTFTTWDLPSWPDVCHIDADHWVVKDMPGKCTVVAWQAGNENYLPAQTVYQSFAFKRGIDIKIHLYYSPANKIPYDEIIMSFADALYEASDGLHYLRNVVIYQEWATGDDIDIYWYPDVWPCAVLDGYGGFGYVKMSDEFSGVNFKVDTTAGGYVLAHEWGHYFYGLYDEYAADYGNNDPDHPHPDDIPVYHSIMNSQWNALSGDFGWLNFSVMKNTLNGQGRTAQDRHYGVSGWGKLINAYWLGPDWGHRVFSTELTFGGPIPWSGDAQLQLPDIPASETRKFVNITWVDSPWQQQGAPAPNANDAPPFHASLNSITGSTLIYPEPVIVRARLEQDELIARAAVSATVTTPTGSTSSLLLKDDGISPDNRADDGQYTGYIVYAQNGVYTVTVNFDNHAGNAWFTDIALEHSIGPHGETWVPSTTPVGVDFQVSSSTQITITNWAPDDHSDVRTSATELLPDNYALPGRMDRADDLDVFRVTADVSGTLAVRISSPGLGIMPHIRLFAGDGVTEIGEYDFTPHGKAYFVTRLEASAGETFYVEISDRQGGVGGVYYISAGKPLPFFWEKTLANIYLPLLKR